MRRELLLPLLLIWHLSTCGFALAAEPKLTLVESLRIWDQAPHNAFTDLVRFKDRWFCVFREGQGHVSPDGALRVITSADALAWESAALITSTDSDLKTQRSLSRPTTIDAVRCRYARSVPILIITCLVFR